MGAASLCNKSCGKDSWVYKYYFQKEQIKKTKSFEAKQIQLKPSNLSEANIMIHDELRRNLEKRKFDYEQQKNCLAEQPADRPTRSKENIFKIYEIDHTDLGSGHFGTVKKARRIFDINNQLFAIKNVEKTDDKELYYLFLRELEYQKLFDHPNIVKFHEVYEDSENFHLVIEYLSGGELLNPIIESKGLPEHLVKNYIWQILNAVSYQHSLKICHRDLKPENFMLAKPNSNTQKLIDFGLSTNFATQKMHTVVGSPYYLAPEVLEQEYDERCDLWSVGCIMYTMITGQVPFNGKTNLDVFDKIQDGKYDSQKLRNKSISSNALNVVSQLQTKDYKKRPYGEQILQHQWFKDIRSEIRSEENKKITTEVVYKMKSFWGFSYFQREIIKLMVQIFEEDSEIERIKTAFYYLDTDHSGTLEIDEIMAFYEENNIHEDYSKLSRIMNNFYQKQRGVVTFTELIATGLGREYFGDPERLKVIFKSIDLDKTGEITIDNIEQCFKRFGRYLTREKIQDFVKECDDNDDGLIQFDEFVSLMNKTATYDDYQCNDLLSDKSKTLPIKFYPYHKQQQLDKAMGVVAEMSRERTLRFLLL